MKLFFIVNPHSGSYQAKDTEQSIKNVIQNSYSEPGSPVQYEIFTPKKASHLKDGLRQKLEATAIDIVAVVGGDGTVMDALEVLIDFPQVKLGIIPKGTGNLLAANLGIPFDTAAALNLLFRGEVFQLDIGRIGDKFFALTAGVGIDAEIMEQTDKAEKKRLGIGAYFLKGLQLIFKARRTHLRVTVDGRKVNAHGIGVVVSNVGNLLGPFLSLAPDAAPNDGNLHVCILKVRRQEDLLAAFLQILTQQYSDDAKQAIQYLRGRKILIDSVPHVKVEADGNVIGHTPIEIEALPGKIQVLVPPKQSAFNSDPSAQLGELTKVVQRSLNDFLTSKKSQ